MVGVVILKVPDGVVKFNSLISAAKQISVVNDLIENNGLRGLYFELKYVLSYDILYV